MNIISPCIITQCCVVYTHYLTLSKLSFKIFPCVMQLHGVHVEQGYTLAQLVEALCYKPEGRGFNSQ